VLLHHFLLKHIIFFTGPPGLSHNVKKGIVKAQTIQPMDLFFCVYGTAHGSLKRPTLDTLAISKITGEIMHL
jgi:hypothetical protein